MSLRKSLRTTFVPAQAATPGQPYSRTCYPPPPVDDPATGIAGGRGSGGGGGNGCITSIIVTDTEALAVTTCFQDGKIISQTTVRG